VVLQHGGYGEIITEDVLGVMQSCKPVARKLSCISRRRIIRQIRCRVLQACINCICTRVWHKHIYQHCRHQATWHSCARRLHGWVHRSAIRLDALYNRRDDIHADSLTVHSHYLSTAHCGAIDATVSASVTAWHAKWRIIQRSQSVKLQGQTGLGLSVQPSLSTGTHSHTACIS